MAVTNEDVVWCYHSILGREPESAQVIQRHISAAEDFRSLVLGFINSSEYIQKKLPLGLVHLDRPDIHVELMASSLELALLGNRVREAWTHMGVARPHHSVLSGKDYLPQFINKNAIDRFYASGAREVATINAVLRRHGFYHPESKTCVEYGCGLGRVTFALAKMFKKVHGYDISTAHLTLAERNTSDTGIYNIDFHLCSADVSRQNLEDCDFFYSRIVFQHNPPPVMRELIVASLKSLRPGGVAIFQVPTYGTGYAFHIQEYLASPQRLDMEMHCIPQSEVFLLIAEAHCKMLELREDRSIGRLGQWISNTFVVQRPARPSPRPSSATSTRRSVVSSSSTDRRR